MRKGVGRVKSNTLIIRHLHYWHPAWIYTHIKNKQKNISLSPILIKQEEKTLLLNKIWPSALVYIPFFSVC